MKKITVIGPGLDVAFPGMSLLRTTIVAAGIAAFSVGIMTISNICAFSPLKRA